MPRLHSLDSLYIKFGKGDRAPPISSNVSPRVIVWFCTILQTFQLLSFVLRPYSTSKSILTFPEQLIYSIFSVRSWMDFTGLPIALFFGIFLTITVFLFLIRGYFLRVFTRTNRVPRIYQFIVEHRILFYYRTLIFVPTLEVGLVMALNHQKYVAKVCSVSIPCYSGMFIGGVILILLSGILYFFLELLNVQKDYHFDPLMTRFNVFKPIIRILYTAILGGVAMKFDSQRIYFIISYVWAGIVFFETLVGIYYLEYVQMYANKAQLITQIIAIHIICHFGFLSWKREELSIFGRIITGLLIKLALNLQQRTLLKGWRSLNAASFKSSLPSLERIDRSMKTLYYELLNRKQFDHEFLEALGPVVAHYRATTTSEQREEQSLFEYTGLVHPSQFQYADMAKGRLIKAIEARYKDIITTQGKKTPLWFLISYVGFMTAVCSKHIQAMFTITNIRKDYKGQIGSRNRLHLQMQEEDIKLALQAESESKNRLDIDDVCDYIRQYDECRENIDKFIQDKVALLAKFMDTTIHMKHVKNESRNLFRRSIEYTTAIEKLMHSKDIHIETHLLYQFFVKDIQEDLNRFTKASNPLAIKRLREIIQRSDTVKKADFSNEALLNSNLNEIFMFLVVSLQPAELGKILKYSPNFANYLDFSDSFQLEKQLDDFFAPFQSKSVEKFLRTVENISDAEAQNQRLRYTFLNGKNGQLLKCYSRMQLAVFQGTLSMSFYFRIDNATQDQTFVLFDSRGKIIHISDDAVEAFYGKVSQEKKAEILRFHVNILDVLPEFELPSTTHEDYQGVSKVKTLSKSMTSKSIHGSSITYQVQRIEDEIGQEIYWKLNIFTDKKSLREMDSSFRMVIRDSSTTKNISSKGVLENTKSLYERQMSRGERSVDTAGNTLFAYKGSAAASQTSQASQRSEISRRSQFNPPESGGGGDNWTSGDDWFDKEGQSFNQKFQLNSEISDIQRSMSGSRQLTRIFSAHPIPKQDFDQDAFDDVNDEDFFPQKSDNNINGQPIGGDPNEKQMSSNKANDSKHVDGTASRQKQRKHVQQASIYASRSSDTSFSKGNARFLIGIYHLKEMINKGGRSHFLIQTNVFGTVALLLAALLIMIFYIILRVQVDLYAQYAKTAYFPSYFASVVKSVAPVAEIANAVNSGIVTNPTYAANMKLTPPAIFKSRIQRFMNTYNKFIVQYNIERVLPGINSKRYALNFSRSTFDTVPGEFDFQSSVSVLLGLIYAFNKTEFSLLNNDNADIQFCRKVYWDYIDMYNLMRRDLFTSFYEQQDAIKTTLRQFFTNACIFGSVIFVIFIYFARKIQKHEGKFLSKLSTISDDHVINYFKKLQMVYSLFYGKALRISTIEQKKVKKIDKHSSTNTVSKKFSNESYNSATYIALFSIIPTLFALLTMICFVIFQEKIDSTTVFIQDLDLQSELVPVSGATIAAGYIQFNTLTHIDEYDRRYAALVDLKARLISYMQNIQNRILSNPVANDQIKEMYYNVTNSNFCFMVNGTIYEKTCYTAYNGASHLGIGSLFGANADQLTSSNIMFEDSPTWATANYIINTKDWQDLTDVGVALDAVFVYNVETEGAFLFGYCMTIEGQLIIILISGYLLVFFLGVLVWRPIFKRMEIQFMHIRQIFSQLPAEIIVHNNYIKNILKNDQGSL